jgi:ankyrin repeat protein
LVEQGLSVNEIDTYGQNAIFYSVNLGHLEVCKLLKSYGSDHDHIDDYQQTPMYYAIKSNKLAVFEWLISLGVDLKITDRRGQSLMNHAIRYNRQQMKEILMKLGGNNRPAPPVPDPRPPPKPQKLQPKKYVLQVFDGSQYRPISQEEFEAMANDHPDIAKLFEDEKEAENIQVPPID